MIKKHLTSRDYRALVEAYILGAIRDGAEAYEVSATTDRELLEFFADSIRSEYAHELARVSLNRQKWVTNYLQGLPTVCSVDFVYFNIAKRVAEWNGMPVADLSDEQVDLICNQWFDHIAFAIVCLCRSNSVDL